MFESLVKGFLREQSNCKAMVLLSVYGVVFLYLAKV
jgi:hypothetical protein